MSADESTLTPQTPSSPLDVKTFAAQVKSKYPDYDGVEDYELTQKIISKYPDYTSGLKSYGTPGSDKLIGTTGEMLRHWDNLQGQFESEGLQPQIRAGFRTAKQENDLFLAGYPTKGNDGYNKISPHQEGRALDISFPANQKARGRAIIADYARKNGLHVPSDEPWHIAVPKNGMSIERTTVELAQQPLTTTTSPSATLPDQPQERGNRQSQMMMTGRGYQEVPYDPNHPDEGPTQAMRRLEMNAINRGAQGDPLQHAAAIRDEFGDPTAAQFPVSAATKTPLYGQGYGAEYNKSPLDPGYSDPPIAQPNDMEFGGMSPAEKTAYAQAQNTPNAIDNFSRIATAKMAEQRQRAAKRAQLQAKVTQARQAMTEPVELPAAGGRGAGMARVNVAQQAKAAGRPVIEPQPRAPRRKGQETIGEGLVLANPDAMGSGTARPTGGVGDLRRLDDPEAARIIRIQNQVASEQSPIDKERGMAPGISESGFLEPKVTANEEVLRRVAIEKGQEQQQANLARLAPRVRAEVLSRDYAQKNGYLRILDQLGNRSLSEIAKVISNAPELVPSLKIAEQLGPQGFVDALHKAQSYLQDYSTVQAAAAQYEPPNVTGGQQATRVLANMGFDVAKLTAAVAITKLPLSSVMVGESIVMNADKPAKEQIESAGKAYLVGRALEVLPEAAQKGLEKVPAIGNIVAAHPEVAARTIAGVGFGTISGVGEALAGGTKAQVLGAALGGGLTGAVLAGGGPKEIARGAMEYVVRSPLSSEPVKDVVASVMRYGKGLMKSEDGRNLSLYKDAAGKVFGNELTSAQAKNYDPSIVTGGQRPVRNAKTVSGEEYDQLVQVLNIKTKTPAKQIEGLQNVAPISDAGLERNIQKSTEPVRHVDLQPRDESGQFDEETPAQAEARRAQVAQSVSTPQAQPAIPDTANVTPQGADRSASMPDRRPAQRNVEMMRVSDLGKFADKQSVPNSSEENAQLKDQIQKEGITEPLILSYDPNTKRSYLSEGNNRLAIAKELGIKELPVRVLRSDATPSKGTQVSGYSEQGHVPSEMPPSQIGVPSRTQSDAGRSAPNENEVGTASEVAPIPEMATMLKGTKAVDAQGSPVRVYHGTHERVDEFDSKQAGSRMGYHYEGGPAFFFTDSRENANQYAYAHPDVHPYAHPNVVPAYLNLKNPLVVDAENPAFTTMADAIKTARRGGNDGVVVKNFKDSPSWRLAEKQTTYVAFDPEQIVNALSPKAKSAQPAPPVPEGKPETSPLGGGGVEPQAKPVEAARVEPPSFNWHMRERDGKWAIVKPDGTEVSRVGDQKVAEQIVKEMRSQPDESQGMSLGQALRAKGGVRPDDVNGGEWKRLSNKETGSTGLVNSRAGQSEEDVAQSLAEDGFGWGDWAHRVDDHKLGRGVYDIDLNRFRDAVEADVSGQKRQFSNTVESDSEAEYRQYLQSQQDEHDADQIVSLLENEQSGSLYDKIVSGQATEAEVNGFRGHATELGISPEAQDKLIASARQGGISEASELSGSAGGANRSPDSSVNPEGQKARSLPKTFKAAEMETGKNLYYTPASIKDDGVTLGKQLVADKGIDGAIEFVKTGDGIEWASTGYEVLANLRQEETDLRESNPKAADLVQEKRLRFLDDFVESATERGRSIVGIKAIEEFAPDRAVYLLNKASQKKRKRGISPEEDARMASLGQELERERDRSKNLEAALAEATVKAIKRGGKTSAKPVKATYQSKLDQQGELAKASLAAKLGSLSFGNLTAPKGQSGKVQIGTPELPDDAELLAQYAASRLDKVDTVADLNAEMVKEFGKEIEPHLSIIRQRAYQIRHEARLAELETKDTEAPRRRTILQEIQKEISAARQVVQEQARKAEAANKDWEKYIASSKTAEMSAAERRVAQAERAWQQFESSGTKEKENATKRAALAQERVNAKDAKAKAQLAAKATEATHQAEERRMSTDQRKRAQQEAKAAREQERSQREVIAREARHRLADAKREYQEAAKAETRGYRETIKAGREAARSAGLWDTPIRNEAKAARERMPTNDPKSPATMDDLVSIAAEKMLPKSFGGAVRKGVISPVQLYSEMRSEFPALVTKKNKGEIYKRAYQRIEDMTTAAREAARLRSASAESQRIWNEQGMDIDAQGILIQKAEVARRQSEIRKQMVAEFNRVSRSRIGKIIHEAEAIPRALQTTLNMHQGRQGLYAILTHPISVTAKVGIPATLKGYAALTRPQYIQRVRELQEHPYYKLGEKAGLNLAELPGTVEDAKLAVEEDELQSTVAMNLPHVRLSNQGFALGMNSERVQLFGVYAAIGEAEGYTWESNPDFFKEIAGIANDATGRGTMPKAIQGMARLTNHIFYATRLNVSRVKLLNDLFNPWKYHSYDPVTRRIMVKEAIKIIVALAALYYAARLLGLHTEIDPNNPDTGKIVWGHTHYDLTGGIGTDVRFAYRMIRGVAKEVAGMKIAENEKPLALGERFVRQKLAPWPTAVIDYLSGKNAVGEPANLNVDVHQPAQMLKENIAVRMLVPIVAADFANGFADDGWLGAAKESPVLLGFGAQTYEPKHQKPEALSAKEPNIPAKTKEIVDKEFKRLDIKTGSVQGSVDILTELEQKDAVRKIMESDKVDRKAATELLREKNILPQDELDRFNQSYQENLYRLANQLITNDQFYSRLKDFEKEDRLDRVKKIAHTIARRDIKTELRTK